MVEVDKKDFFKDFSFEIIGDFICYRRSTDTEQRINILKLNGTYRELKLDKFIQNDKEIQKHITF